MNTKVDECKLISGKEALIALANGKMAQLECDIGWCDIDDWQDWDIKQFTVNYGEYKFRLKPRTITINGIEVPAPFKPKMNQKYFYLYTENMSGYGNDYYEENLITKMRVQFGVWRTEEEIKQVVAALRQIFGDSHD